MKIDENTIIKCNNLEEVKDCLDKLKELGFDVCFNNNKDQLIVNQSKDINSFQNYIWTKFYPENFCVNYKTFIKLYNKQIKENKQPDLVFDKNKKIIKVNSIDKYYEIFVHSSYGNWIDKYTLSGECIAATLLEVDYYVLKEDLEKALKRKETENKLRMIAETLNSQVKHMYSLFETNVPKYSISIEYTRSLETKLHCCMCGNNFIKNQGTIYCYSKDFLNKALELIGEENLKDYLINC